MSADGPRWRPWVAAASAVAGALVTLAVPWMLNDDPGARSVMPGVITGLVVLVFVLVLGARWALSNGLRVVTAFGVLGATALAVGIVPSLAVASRVRADDELEARALALLAENPLDRIVVVTARGMPRHGLVYVRDGGDVPPADIECRRHLFGHWWEYSGFHGANCPAGFSFPGYG